MPMFKPLTRSSQSLAKTAKDSVTEKKLEVTERIHIIYDDSGSMGQKVKISDTEIKSKIALAAEATDDFLRYCKPWETSVAIAPFESEAIYQTTNLPVIAAKVKTYQPMASTPLFEALGKAVDRAEVDKLTHIIIFTDGQATDEYYFDNRPSLFAEAKELGIPIDLIIIGDTTRERLQQNRNTEHFIDLAEKSGGTFLICKDGKAFREKMKYFAPTLRYMLPQIASKES